MALTSLIEWQTLKHGAPAACTAMFGDVRPTFYARVMSLTTHGRSHINNFISQSFDLCGLVAVR